MRQLAIVCAVALALVAAALAETPTVQGRQQVVQQARPVAVQSLARLTRMVTQQNFARMGFSNVQQLRSATLGDPLQVFNIWLNDLKQYQSGADPMNLLRTADELLYPVVAEAQVRSSLTVRKVNNQWEPSAYGRPGLIKMVAAATSQAASQKGFAQLHFLVQVPAMNLAFLGYHDGTRLMLVPLIDDPRFGLKRGTAMPATEVLSKLVPVAREQTDMPS